MKLEFDYFMPTRIYFGVGKLSQLAKARRLHGKKALIVISSGSSMKKYGYLDRAIGYLRDNNTQSIVFDKIVPNPILEHVMEGAALAKQENCDFVVGLGGGSSIDSAKSIAMMAKNPGDYWDYMWDSTGKGRRSPTEGALPIVAITTTAGTGTEADPWTVITKPDTKEKLAWGASCTFPTLSIVDPELMTSIPPHLTAYQGMDAFFHAVEGYISTANCAASDVHALDAIGLVIEYLPVAVRDGSNLEARSAMAWASTQAGLAVTFSTSTALHALEHALTAYHPNIAHGAGLTAIAVPFFTHLAKHNVTRLSDIARKMGENMDVLPDAEKPFAFVTALNKIIKSVGLEKINLASLGVKKEEADAIAQNSFDTTDVLHKRNPVRLDKQDAVSIIEASF